MKKSSFHVYSCDLMLFGTRSPAIPRAVENTTWTTIGQAKTLEPLQIADARGRRTVHEEEYL
jgi:hypothetical protein